MKRTIKSPTGESGARIHSRVGESIRYDYTLLSLICNIKPTIFYTDRIHRHLINPHRDLISAENILKGVEKC